MPWRSRLVRGEALGERGAWGWASSRRTSLTRFSTSANASSDSLLLQDSASSSAPLSRASWLLPAPACRSSLGAPSWCESGAGGVELPGALRKRGLGLPLPAAGLAEGLGGLAWPHGDICGPGGDDGLGVGWPRCIRLDHLTVAMWPNWMSTWQRCRRPVDKSPGTLRVTAPSVWDISWRPRCPGTRTRRYHWQI